MNIMNQTRNQYRPDYVSPPGETLSETLESLGLSQADLAERTGRPKKTINEIIKGKAAITPATALQLERVLGVPASFWNQREYHYREFLAREEEKARLRKQVEWLDRLPVKSLIKLGWIEASKDKVTLLQHTLNFFGVATPQKWDELWRGSQPAFRKSRSFKSNPAAVAAWLRKGEVDAQRINCASYNEAKFKSVLRQIRGLTITGPEYYEPELVRLCASAGVAVVFVPELPGTRVFGATRWLTPNKAVIQLSLRYKTDDHLWFTFFHEAGHILLHGKTKLFLEDDSDRDGQEGEANRFSAEMLIPERDLRRFKAKDERNLEAIKTFAKEIGLAPGIVVGRLQHEGFLPRSHGNGLKARCEWPGTK
jgi:addiction module HigA family antidote